MIIREALASEFDAVMEVERRAFGEEDEARLVADLLGDSTAKPLLSLVAMEGETMIGHILFTRLGITPAADLNIQILAPLAVVPGAQNKGVGAALFNTSRC